MMVLVNCPVDVMLKTFQAKNLSSSDFSVEDAFEFGVKDPPLGIFPISVSTFLKLGFCQQH